jgi:HAD domain in Swiss Army Knife RNA repair proteins
MSSSTIKTRVIFLDVDGVLCLAGASLYALGNKKTFHEPAVSLLKELVESATALQTQTQIVVISSWRTKQTSLDGVATRLSESGISNDCMRGATPAIARERRDEEIVAWLEENGDSEEEAISWVVLDDSDSKFGGKFGAKVRKHLVHIDSSYGIRDVDVKMALRLFAKQATKLK